MFLSVLFDRVMYVHMFCIDRRRVQTFHKLLTSCHQFITIDSHLYADYPYNIHGKYIVNAKTLDNKCKFIEFVDLKIVLLLVTIVLHL